ncbi:carbon starvation CstA family protein [Oribacterium sp. WCC10]|uniref:carbon starvation CstA family protein n=1 Tax=Oribacterium sp. WCC10 TaxID=1855343 RepID=UPI0008E160C2|nr:carbon starvation CstA family protein [Oribacterium sp. WCC10]SFG65632.1 carbon starvation protein [Oribacterium sp. WCC10]
MNSLVILLVAGLALLGGYLLYGRYLAKTWGIDEKAVTPATKFEDGEDYVPSSKLTVFSHQFSSIAGAGPVQGPILAAAFGWVPCLLWLLFGGIFFGAVQDFGAMYASVKNDGKSIGMIIEKYIGKAGRRFFSLFCWLFTLLVIAAFTSMVSSTFNGFTKAADGTSAQNFNGAAAATISMLFIFVAMAFGLVEKRFKDMKEGMRVAVAIALLVGMFAVGMVAPIYLTAPQWNYVIMAYLFAASVMPMWLLMQPRDYLTTFMLLGMIIGAVLGLVVAHPEMKLNAFNGFVLTAANGSHSYIFPTLFVTIACGAVSGFHSLVSSGTSSKTVKNEKDMLFIGYGAMVIETLLGVCSLLVCGAVAVNGAVPADLTPFQIFSQGVAGFLETFGVPNSVANVFMTMCVSALALTSLDSVARIGRMSFQELFASDETDKSKIPAWQKLFQNQYFATAITLFFGYLLCLGGYANVWALFGSANQMLAALVLIGIAVFLKATGRKSAMLYIPMAIMLTVTFSAIVLNIIGNVKAFAAGTGTFLVNGLQLIVAAFLIVLGVLVAVTCIKKLLATKAGTDRAAGTTAA